MVHRHLLPWPEANALRFHDLRHSAATLQLGMAIQLNHEMLGGPGLASLEIRSGIRLRELRGHPGAPAQGSGGS